jgi:sporulation protein YlmC with PRC-barrel domain
MRHVVPTEQTFCLVRCLDIGKPTTQRGTGEETDMRKIRFAASALACALSASLSYAQVPQPLPQAVTGSASALRSIPDDARTVTEWHKQNVYDPTDTKIGEVMDVLIDRDGRVAALIIGAGTFLGMSNKDVAVPFDAVQFKTKDNKSYPVMNTTKDALKSAPGYKYDRTSMKWMPDSPSETMGAAPVSPGPASPQPVPAPR